MDFILHLFDDMLFATLPAIGFALMFNVPKRALKYCAFLSALGHGVRTVLIQFDFPLALATFFGATVIGFLGVYLSHRYLAHPKVFTVAAIVPMIPGVYAYKAMIAMVEINHYGYSPERLQNFVNNFITTTFVIGALSFGLALPGMLFYRHKPVV